MLNVNFVMCTIALNVLQTQEWHQTGATKGNDNPLIVLLLCKLGTSLLDFQEWQHFNYAADEIALDRNEIVQTF